MTFYTDPYDVHLFPLSLFGSKILILNKRWGQENFKIIKKQVHSYRKNGLENDLVFL